MMCPIIGEFTCLSLSVYMQAYQLYQMGKMLSIRKEVEFAFYLSIMCVSCNGTLFTLVSSI